MNLQVQEAFAQVSSRGVPLERLVQNFSIEATPRQLRQTGSLGKMLPARSSVYVPYLPKAALTDTIAACSSLVAEGMRPVPHLAARTVSSRDELCEQLEGLSEAGADALLLIAGDRSRAAGPFRSTLDVFDTGLLQRYGFCSIGVAGHPEGHPAVGEEAAISAMREKAQYASDTASTMWIVTQFAFSAEPVVDWLVRMQDAAIDLPVRVGLPGPANLKTLLRYAVHCGVGASSRVLARRPDAVSRLLGRWTPAEMLASLARHAVDHRALPIAGIHVFPFGGLPQSIGFFSRMLARSERQPELVP